MPDLKRIVMFKPFVSDRAVLNAMRVLQSGWVGEGPVVVQFENTLRQIFKYEYPVATNNATGAIHMALNLAGVEYGDEVITTPLTCTATNHPILYSGAVPVFADIQYLTGNIDPDSVADKITTDTRAIMAVSWGGYPPDLKELSEVAKSYHLPLILDAAQGLGSVYHREPIDVFPDYTIISFQAIKIVTTVDGGALLVPTAEDEIIAKEMRWYGINRAERTPTVQGYWDWPTQMIGYKYHMNDVAASIGLGNLGFFSSLFKKNQDIANRYRVGLSTVDGVTVFSAAPDRVGTNWFFTIHVERRDDFAKAMRDRGVDVSIVHKRNDLDPIFGGDRLDLPVLNRFEKSYIALPVGWHLEPEDVEYVISAIEAGW